MEFKIYLANINWSAKKQFNNPYFNFYTTTYCLSFVCNSFQLYKKLN